MNLVILDYGLCNLLSVYNALKHLGVDSKVTCDPIDLKNADLAILPGVGAFADGMHGLQTKGLISPIRDFVKTGKPFLGICLGAQLLLDRSYEFGVHQGLGLIPGEVVGFSSQERPSLKIPHISWNRITPANPWEGTLLEGLKHGEQMYFVHSFYLQPKDEHHALARTDYGPYDFCSVVYNGNVMGCQFHPEKSAQGGLKILNNFVRLAKGVCS